MAPVRLHSLAMSVSVMGALMKWELLPKSWLRVVEKLTQVA
jgi:hypothetical protein